jgi:hypothetical protein
MNPLDEKTDAGDCNQTSKSNNKGFGRERCDFTHHQTQVELSDPSSAVIPDIKNGKAIVKNRSLMLILCCLDNYFIKLRHNT